jgi:hypothetical protein
MYRSLAVALMMLIPAGLAHAQSVYVAPGGVYIGSANVYMAPGNGGAYVAPGAVYGRPPLVAAPLPGPAYVPDDEPYEPQVYEAPLSAYGSARVRTQLAPAGRYVVRERVIMRRLDAVPRPPAPIPYVRTR